ncbi:hypothetical protein D3C81_1376260 [compost metagenome]
MGIQRGDVAGAQAAARFAEFARHGDGHILDQKWHAGERRRVVDVREIGWPQLDHGVYVRVDGGAGAHGRIVQFSRRDGAIAH